MLPVNTNLTAENCRVSLLYPQWIVLSDCNSGKIYNVAFLVLIKTYQ